MVNFLRNPKIYIKMSVAVNSCLAIGKLLLGFFTSSVFIALNGMYNAGMGLAKLMVLKGLDSRRENVYGLLKRVGTVLLITSLIYVIYSAFTLSAEKHEKYPPLAAAVIVVVVFAEIVVNIAGLVSTKKSKRLVLHANKCLSFSSSLINLVLVQTALMSLPDWRFIWLLNGLSGVTLGSVASLIGAYLIMYEIFLNKSKGKRPRRR